MDLERIYLDHNATTRPLPEVVEAMVACLRDGFGNPSSVHAFGQRARRLLDRAREQVAALIKASPEEIIFTASGTEADNQALRCVAAPGTAIATSVIEHPAILNTCRFLEAAGTQVTYFPVDAQGILRMDTLEAALKPDISLLSLMAANNDLGTLQPVAEAADLARSRGILVHTDAVQAAGRIPLDVRSLGVDLLSLSAHKLHGPKGVGALFVKRALPLRPLIQGGSQERRLRAGTENLPGIVGFGIACEWAAKHMDRNMERITALRTRLEEGLLAIPGVRLHGHPTLRLPNTVNVGLPILGEDLLLNLDLEGIAVSVGSACSSESREPSFVLKALGIPDQEARQTLRFSLGFENTDAEIDRTIQVTRSLLARLT